MNNKHILEDDVVEKSTFIEKSNNKNNCVGMKGVALLFLMFTLTACSSNRTVDVSYNMCSKYYRCDSASIGAAATPVHFVLPENHGDMVITFITSPVFGFTESYSAAIATNQFLQPYGEMYADTSIPDALDLAVGLASTDIKATAMYYTDENDVFMSLAQSISGYQAGVYFISVLDDNNDRILTGQLPAGKTVMFLSESVKSIDIYSHIDSGLNNFFKADPVPGTVAYENAYEINESSYQSNSGKVVDKDDDFSIIGTWKSVGSYGFGQAQPGATVTFGENHCNFYSPNDTYTFTYEGSIGTLECENWLFKDDVLTFAVNIIDNDKISIVHGKEYTTTLERVR